MRWLTPLALVIGGCGGWGAAGSGCGVVEGPRALPGELAETSGVAPSLRTPGAYWTHSDDRRTAEIWAVDARGGVLGTIALDGIRSFDLEDVAVAPCPEGSCIYLGDVGDNYAERDTLVVFRLAEPEVSARSVTPVPLRFVLPNGPRDAEAIFVLPGEQLFIVTKGSEAPIAVYRYPPPLRPDETVTLEEVQLLSETPRVLPRQVTGASASSDGTVVVLRTYETLLFHRWDGSKLVPLEEGTVNLRSLREAQGEGVGISNDGSVVLTSEGGPARASGSITVLRCRFGDTD